jgi:hypothetical protein
MPASSQPIAPPKKKMPKNCPLMRPRAFGRSSLAARRPSVWSPLTPISSSTALTLMKMSGGLCGAGLGRAGHGAKPSAAISTRW